MAFEYKIKFGGTPSYQPITEENFMDVICNTGLIDEWWSITKATDYGKQNGYKNYTIREGHLNGNILLETDSLEEAVKFYKDNEYPLKPLPANLWSWCLENGWDYDDGQYPNTTYLNERERVSFNNCQFQMMYYEGDNGLEFYELFAHGSKYGELPIELYLSVKDQIKLLKTYMEIYGDIK